MDIKSAVLGGAFAVGFVALIGVGFVVVTNRESDAPAITVTTPTTLTAFDQARADGCDSAMSKWEGAKERLAVFDAGEKPEGTDNAVWDWLNSGEPEDRTNQQKTVLRLLRQSRLDSVNSAWDSAEQLCSD